jgi:hypothetical protein
MTFLGRSLWFTLGGVVVAAFLLFADDLNDWFHRRAPVEYAKTDKAVEAAPPRRDEAADRRAADAAAPSSSGATGDRAPTASRQESHQTAERASQAELRVREPERRADGSSAPINNREVAAEVRPEADRRAADTVARASEPAVQERMAPANQQVVQSEQRADATREAQGRAVVEAPAEKPATGPMANVEKPAGGVGVDASAKSNAVASADAKATEAESAQKAAVAQPLDRAPAEMPGRDTVADKAKVDESPKSNDKATEQTAQREPQAEPAQKEVAAQAPSQPLERAPGEAPKADVVANADAKIDSPKVEEAARSADKATEQTAQREPQAEPAQKEVAVQAPSQPLERGPGEAPKADVVANAEAKADSAKVDEAEKPSDKATEQAVQRGPQAEPAQKEVAVQAPSQPLERAPGEAPKADVVANAEAKADSAKVDEAAKPRDKATEQTVQRAQQAEPTQRDAAAQAPSQPLDREPGDPKGDVVANAEAKADSAKVDEAAKPSDKATEQTVQRAQQAEPGQKNEAAQAPSQPLERAPGEAPKGDVVAKAEAKIDSPKAEEAAKASDKATEQTVQRAQQAEPGQKNEAAQAPSQPLDRAPAEAPKRDVVVKAEAKFGSAKVEEAAKPSDKATEQTVQRAQQAEPAHKNEAAPAPSQPLERAPAEDPKREAVAGVGAQASGAKPADAAKSAGVVAVEQTSNLRSQQGEPAQKDVTAKAPSQPLAGAPGEAPARAMPRAIGGDRWVISETTSPLDYTPMVTASISLQSGASRMKLSIYCRRGRTDVELASDAPDTATGSLRDIVVTHSITHTASIAQRWDVRGSIASFKGDAVAFLRSLPDQGELGVRMSDDKSVLHEGRVVLDGLKQVRDRLASACKWPEAGTAPSSQERSNRTISKRGRTQ